MTDKHEHQTKGYFMATSRTITYFLMFIVLVTVSACSKHGSTQDKEAPKQPSSGVHNHLTDSSEYRFLVASNTQGSKIYLDPGSVAHPHDGSITTMGDIIINYDTPRAFNNGTVRSTEMMIGVSCSQQQWVIFKEWDMSGSNLTGDTVTTKERPSKVQQITPGSALETIKKVLCLPDDKRIIALDTIQQRSGNSAVRVVSIPKRKTRPSRVTGQQQDPRSKALAAMMQLADIEKESIESTKPQCESIGEAVQHNLDSATDIVEQTDKQVQRGADRNKTNAKYQQAYDIANNGLSMISGADCP